jgi:hypothetical protein
LPLNINPNKNLNLPLNGNSNKNPLLPSEWQIQMRIRVCQLMAISNENTCLPLNGNLNKNFYLPLNGNFKQESVFGRLNCLFLTKIKTLTFLFFFVGEFSFVFSFFSSFCSIKRSVI